MIIAGFGGLVIGVYLVVTSSSAYTACHSWSVDPTQPACQSALAVHGWGVGITIVASVLLISGQIMKGRTR